MSRLGTMSWGLEKPSLKTLDDSSGCSLGLSGLGQSLQVCDALGDALLLLRNKQNTQILSLFVLCRRLLEPLWLKGQ